ncbi:MAG TPA: CDGSH iron-sulfur domain-containing protein [Bryobacteraceae bacterium]|jgi:CDGSH-type Zn-finger protein|nr:CDGSH iron-sulfur domain-containing protein [Bryobacteraceae bacterium]
MPTKVTVLNNGPVRIEGDFEIVDAQGRPYGLAGRKAISLCRCGHSQNKPFCDGSHKSCSFESVCEARELPAPVPKVQAAL